jgi:hypothetical protein
MAKNAVKKTETATDVVVAGPTPDYMNKYGMAGMEGIEAGDVETPRISLLQALSPEVEKFSAKQGNFWHNILQQDLGSSLDMVLVHVEKTAVLWRPRAEGGGILARQVGNRWEPSNAKFEINVGGRTVVLDTKGSVAESGLLNWQGTNPPPGTLMYNFVMYLPARPDASPAVMTFSKTSLQPAKRMLSALKIGGKPAFGLSYTMTSEKVSNQKGSFYIPKFTMTGVTSQEDCERYFEMSKIFSNRTIGISEREQGEGDDTGGSGNIDQSKF